MRGGQSPSYVLFTSSTILVKKKDDNEDYRTLEGFF